jgi:hypothetical protein
MSLRPDPAMSDAATLRAAEDGMQRLNRAYSALLHRVDNTPPEELLQDAGSSPRMTLRLPKLAVPRIAMPRVALSGFAMPEFAMPKLAMPALSRVAAVAVVVAAVAYGIVHGVAQKEMSPPVVDAKTVAAPQVHPVVSSKPVAEVEKPVREAEPEAVVAPRRALRAPSLPGLDAEDAKVIADTCRAENSNASDSETPEDFRDCVVRTAQATPRPIHLD